MKVYHCEHTITVLQEDVTWENLETDRRNSSIRLEMEAVVLYGCETWSLGIKGGT
jgi:hypothetical protein